ncbi:unnamed protein product [Strongylus vulgaris]|uniref:Uncharacterized protein n=1 Tax=Strongylus vulgaris TaxID=40348 RepID=A0A3P7J9D4_STRVU|nr:unnamed protein product [Strongylus vulgaris]
MGFGKISNDFLNTNSLQQICFYGALSYSVAAVVHDVTFATHEVIIRVKKITPQFELVYEYSICATDCTVFLGGTEPLEAGKRGEGKNSGKVDVLFW